MNRLLKKNKITLVCVTLTIIGMVILLKYILFVGFVPTESMAPTIQPGNCLIGTRLSIEDIKTKDVVIVKKDDKVIIKRVLAVEGDTIEYNNKNVYINGKNVGKCPDQENKIFSVPTGRYYVLGDNRENSSDSRYWSDPYVEKSKLISKLIFVLRV